jgi:hypothetical protein
MVFVVAIWYASAETNFQFIHIKSPIKLLTMVPSPTNTQGSWLHA